MHAHVVPATQEQARAQGTLFAEPASTLNEQRAARRATMSDRVRIAADLVAKEPDEPWLFWCELNDEAESLRKALYDNVGTRSTVVEIRGKDYRDIKVDVAQWFAADKCRCGNQSTTNDGASATRATTDTERKETISPFQTLSVDANTCANTTLVIPKDSESKGAPEHPSETRDEEQTTQSMSNSASSREHRRANGSELIRASDSTNGCEPSGSPLMTTIACSPNKAADAQSVAEPTTVASGSVASTSITVTKPAKSAGSSALAVTSELVSSMMIRSDLQRRCPTCGGLRSERGRVLVSKQSIFGYGMNFQSCARVGFVGVSHSFEGWYQAIRRCWRFGQKREVHCAETFMGPCPVGCVVNHRDGIKSNNDASNLEYVTHRQNVNHAISAIGRRKGPTKPVAPPKGPQRGDEHWSRRMPERVARGIRMGGSKLTDDAVIDIRRRVAAGEKQCVLANEYDVSVAQVSRIVRGMRWAHVKEGAS
jgi:hypothetical protein